MISHYYDKAENIFYILTADSISLVDLVNEAKDEDLISALPENLRVMEFADAKLLDTSARDVDKLMDTQRKFLERFKKVTHAVVSADAMAVAFIRILQRRTLDPRYQLEVFFTETAARKWLDMMDQQNRLTAPLGS